ncbi:MAG: sigma-70 family RNA polymerase sigma factor [Verrucomicrobiota bacterium]
MTSDGELLRSYAEEAAEEAFAELVRRHLDLVYSAALRQVNGDAHLAHDIAQTVFTDLARKAAALSGRPVLTGWLYTSTHFAASKAVRTERRRQAREQEAYAMNELLQSAASDFDWDKLRPMLDHVMHGLKESDREIILMRFFENRQLADIGQALGLSEDTARKRVDRALEKLRHILIRQGFGVSMALGTVLSTQAVQTAPAGLAAALTRVAMAGAAAANGTTFSLIKAMTMTKFQTGLIGIVVAAGLLAPLVMQHSIASLSGEHGRLQLQADQAVQLQADNQRFASQPGPVGPTLPPDQYLELLKLRGEVGVQRNQLDKLKSELAARENSATARALRAPVTTNYFPKSAWATAGNATPEAALQSITWAMDQAMSHQDMPALLAAAGPAAQAAAAREFAGKSDAEIDAELAQDAAHFTNIIGLRIINQQIVSPDQVVFTYYYDGQDSFSRIPLQRFGDVWQVGGFPVDP